ncbi:MAG: hypothetical protein RLZ98_166 [Pseudomonadota bacterium]|jgi:glycine betaine/proline transport system substrate-binding protein
MLRSLAKAVVLAGLCWIGSTPPTAHACGRVTVADMNWASATLAANVDKIVLEKGYGCTVVLIPGDTMPTTASMTEKAEPDVAPEIWMNSIRRVIDEAIAAGKLRIAGEILSDGGNDGFWIPAYMLKKHPALTTMAEVLKRPDLFPHPEDSARGAFYNCPSGWNCEIITRNLYRAFGMEKAGFDLIDTGSAAGLDGSLAKAYNRRQPWLGYYWAPTPLLARYEMIKLDLGIPHDAGEWDRCTGQPDCRDPKKNAFTRSAVMTVTSAAFARRAPEAFEYLSRRSWSNKVVDDMLTFMEETQAGAEEAAERFLEKHEATWTRWMPAGVAKKIKTGL